MTNALFEQLDDTTFLATDYSRGPWEPTACHGGPVAAILVRAVERLGADADAGGSDDRSDVTDGGEGGQRPARWHLARMSLELTRPVPVLAPLTVTATVERPGKRVSIADAVMTAGGSVVSRMRVQRVRIADVPLPDEIPTGGPPPLPHPDTATPQNFISRFGSDLLAFHSDSCEHRYVQGGASSEGVIQPQGPVVLWCRLAVPVLEAEQPSGVQRVAAAADFGSGVSAGLPYDDYVFINPDLSIHLTRPPVGDWVGMRCESHYAPTGTGFADTALYDLDGRVGRGVQSLFVDTR